MSRANRALSAPSSSTFKSATATTSGVFRRRTARLLRTAILTYGTCSVGPVADPPQARQRRTFPHAEIPGKEMQCTIQDCVRHHPPSNVTKTKTGNQVPCENDDDNPKRKKLAINYCKRG